MFNQIGANRVLRAALVATYLWMGSTSTVSARPPCDDGECPWFENGELQLCGTSCTSIQYMPGHWAHCDGETWMAE